MIYDIVKKILNVLPVDSMAVFYQINIDDDFLLNLSIFYTFKLFKLVLKKWCLMFKICTKIFQNEVKIIIGVFDKTQDVC